MITQKRSNEGLIALLIGAGILLAVLLGAPKVMGADSVWVQIKPPEVEQPFQSHKMVCQVCGHCYPKLVKDSLTTQQLCPPPHCCNQKLLTFECQTEPPKTFEVKIGECDWIKWGRWIQRKDYDSLVDPDGTTGGKKDKDK